MVLAQHPHSFPCSGASPTSQLSEWEVKWGTISSPGLEAPGPFSQPNIEELHISMNAPYLLCSHFIIFHDIFPDPASLLL